MNERPNPKIVPCEQCGRPVSVYVPPGQHGVIWREDVRGGFYRQRCDGKPAEDPQ